MKAVAALVLALLAAAPAAAQTGSTLVTIAVPPVQALEGVTTFPVPPAAAPYRAEVVVKSNTPWTLVARVSGPARGVAWRTGTGTWVPLGEVTPVLRGERGVHIVAYEVRVQGGGPVQLTLALEAN